MTAEEYFNDWFKFINKQKLKSVLDSINTQYNNKQCEPAYNNIFKVFNITPYDKLKVVFLGQDPYPQKDIATGIAFANKKDCLELSPSLNVLKEAVIDFEIPHNYITFDPTLEEWSKQGILLLNASLTVERNKPNSHCLIWKSFTETFLDKLSLYNPGLIYVLWGKYAQSFKDCIHNGIIMEVHHPSYYARTHTKLPHSFFVELDKVIKEQYDEEILWYNELKN